MPETKMAAKNRAKKLGFPQSQVVKGDEGYYLAPLGVKDKSAQKAYAKCRDEGGAKAKCAAVSHMIQKRQQGK